MEEDGQDQTEDPIEDQAEDGYVPTRTVEGQQERGPRGLDFGIFINTQQNIRTPARTGSVSATGSPQSVETSPTSVVPNMLNGSPIQDARLEHSDEGESNTETLELAKASTNHSEVDNKTDKKHLTTTSLSNPQFQFESPQDYFYNDHYEESNQSGETILTNSHSPAAACEPPPTHGMGAPSSLEGSKSELSELKSSDTSDRESYLY